MALSARAMFLIHGILCLWRVQTVMSSNPFVWFLLIPNLLLIAEGLYGMGFLKVVQSFLGTDRSPAFRFFCFNSYDDCTF